MFKIEYGALVCHQHVAFMLIWQNRYRVQCKFIIFFALLKITCIYCISDINCIIIDYLFIVSLKTLDLYRVNILELLQGP